MLLSCITIAVLLFVCGASADENQEHPKICPLDVYNSFCDDHVCVCPDGYKCLVYHRLGKASMCIQEGREERTDKKRALNLKSVFFCPKKSNEVKCHLGDCHCRFGETCRMIGDNDSECQDGLQRAVRSSTDQGHLKEEVDTALGRAEGTVQILDNIVEELNEDD